MGCTIKDSNVTGEFTGRVEMKVTDDELFLSVLTDNGGKWEPLFTLEAVGRNITKLGFMLIPPAKKEKDGGII